MNKKLTIGVIIGAVAGVISGLLTAPKSGRESRLSLKNKANSWKDKLVSMGDKHKK